MRNPRRERQRSSSEEAIPQQKQTKNNKVQIDTEELEAKRKESKQIAKQLEFERRYRATMHNLQHIGDHLSSVDPDTILWSVGVLQESVEELENNLSAMESGDWDEDSEFKLRYKTQTNLNSKLEEQIDWCDDEVSKMKAKIKKGIDHSYDHDLERYTELELQQMIKELERERNNLYSDLRNSSWGLDAQSKKYHHMKELSRAYAGDLTIVNRSLEQIWRKRSRSHDSGFAGEATPVSSPGALTWSGESGIRPSQRILDPRKGPVRKTVGVRSLPRLDMSNIDLPPEALFRQRKSRSRSIQRKPSRTKSLDHKNHKKIDGILDLSPLSTNESRDKINHQINTIKETNENQKFVKPNLNRQETITENEPLFSESIANMASKSGEQIESSKSDLFDSPGLDIDSGLSKVHDVIQGSKGQVKDVLQSSKTEVNDIFEGSKTDVKDSIRGFKAQVNDVILQDSQTEVDELANDISKGSETRPVTQSKLPTRILERRPSTPYSQSDY